MNDLGRCTNWYDKQPLANYFSGLETDVDPNDGSALSLFLRELCGGTSTLVRLQGFTHYTTRVLHNPAMPGPLTPRHKGAVCGDDDSPLKNLGTL